jgi:hypothetical protein
MSHMRHTPCVLGYLRYAERWAIDVIDKNAAHPMMGARLQAIVLSLQRAIANEGGTNACPEDD